MSPVWYQKRFSHLVLRPPKSCYIFAKDLIPNKSWLFFIHLAIQCMVTWKGETYSRTLREQERRNYSRSFVQSMVEFHFQFWSVIFNCYRSQLVTIELRNFFFTKNSVNKFFKLSVLCGISFSLWKPFYFPSVGAKNINDYLCFNSPVN